MEEFFKNYNIERKTIMGERANSVVCKRCSHGAGICIVEDGERAAIVKTFAPGDQRIIAPSCKKDCSFFASNFSCFGMINSKTSLKVLEGLIGKQFNIETSLKTTKGSVHVSLSKVRMSAVLHRT